MTEWYQKPEPTFCSFKGADPTKHRAIHANCQYFLNVNEIQIDSASVDDIDHQINISKAFLTPFLRAICRARSG
jgi:hypothetical protein